MGVLMGSQKGMIVEDLREKKKSNGKIIIRHEPKLGNDQVLAMKMAVEDILGGWLCCKVATFVTIRKSRGAGHQTHSEEEKKLLGDSGHIEWLKVYQSEVQKGSNVHFSQFNVPIGKLCSGDFNLPLKIGLYQYSFTGNHTLKGEFLSSVNELLNREKQSIGFFDISGKAQGDLILNKVKVETAYQMSDYLRGGTQISLVVGVDFTGSNGDPSSRTSLHYIDPNPDKLNPYQEAILSIGDILLNYDADKLVPIYGFGAILKYPRHPEFGATSMCFPCSGDYARVAGHAVQGVFELYKYALKNVELSGPTYFAPLIKNAVEEARENYRRDPFNYSILLILTDGVIHDMRETKDWIVEGSELPLSIIIVGLGSANFKQMEELDSDDSLLKGSRKTAQRDIVQFVPFEDFKNRPEDLAAEVLQELPNQIVSFYKSAGIAPKKCPKISPVKISKRVVRLGVLEGGNINYPTL